MPATANSAPLVIILGDGGLRGGFVAAAADAVLRRSAAARAQLTHLSGISASAAGVIYYLAFGLDHPGRRIWTEMLGNRQFLHYERPRDLYGSRPLYDLDYLVDVLFRRRFPIDQDKVRASPVTFYIPLQSAETAALKYITNGPGGTLQRGDATVVLQNAASLDLYEVIRAASAAPFVYDRPVRLGGQGYMDAAAIEPLALDLPGYEDARFIVILNSAESGALAKLQYLAMTALYLCLVLPFRRTRFRPHKYLQFARRPFVRNRLLKQVRALERAGRAVLLVPERDLGGLLEDDPHALATTYRHGQKVALRNLPRIERMLAR